MIEIKAKLNEVIKGVVGEKKKYPRNIPCGTDEELEGYNQAKDEIAEREVEVDVYRIEKAIEGRLGICKEHVIQKDEKVMLTFEVDEKSKKTIAKAIAEQILAGNVLKVKEQQ